MHDDYQRSYHQPEYDHVGYNNEPNGYGYPPHVPYAYSPQPDYGPNPDAHPPHPNYDPYYDQRQSHRYQNDPHFASQQPYQRPQNDHGYDAYNNAYYSPNNPNPSNPVPYRQYTDHASPVVYVKGPNAASYYAKAGILGGATVVSGFVFPLATPFLGAATAIYTGKGVLQGRKQKKQRQSMADAYGQRIANPYYPHQTTYQQQNYGHYPPQASYHQESSYRRY